MLSRCGALSRQLHTAMRPMVTRPLMSSRAGHAAHSPAFLSGMTTATFVPWAPLQALGGSWLHCSHWIMAPVVAKAQYSAAQAGRRSLHRRTDGRTVAASRPGLRVQVARAARAARVAAVAMAGAGAVVTVAAAGSGAPT